MRWAHALSVAVGMIGFYRIYWNYREYIRIVGNIGIVGSIGSIVCKTAGADDKRLNKLSFLPLFLWDRKTIELVGTIGNIGTITIGAIEGIGSILRSRYRWHIFFSTILPGSIGQGAVRA